MSKSARAELGNFSLLLVYYLAAARFHAYCFHAYSYQTVREFKRYGVSNDTACGARTIYSKTVCRIRRVESGDFRRAVPQSFSNPT